jgi:hypothetical protein
MMFSEIKDKGVAIMTGSFTGAVGYFTPLLQIPTSAPPQLTVAVNALLGAVLSWLAVELLKIAKEELKDVVTNWRNSSTGSDEDAG